MKTNFKNIGLSFLATIAMSSCSKDDSSSSTTLPTLPTAQSFTNLQNAAYNSVKQQFVIPIVFQLQ